MIADTWCLKSGYINVISLFYNGLTMSSIEALAIYNVECGNLLDSRDGEDPSYHVLGDDGFEKDYDDSSN